jgi:hypothetical protein
MSHETRLVLTLNWQHDVATCRRTQMTLTPVRKPEPCPVFCVKLFLSLDASRRLHKHDTCAPSSYTLILLSNPTQIPCDSRVVNCVRQTFLRDTLTRRDFQRSTPGFPTMKLFFGTRTRIGYSFIGYISYADIYPMDIYPKKKKRLFRGPSTNDTKK